MTIDPVTVAADATIDHAEGLLARNAISGLPVVDGTGRLVGVISQTDLLSVSGTPVGDLIRGRANRLRVGELMSSPAITIPITATLVEAARLMRDVRVHRLVAVDDAGRILGVLSATDFVTLYADS